MSVYIRKLNSQELGYRNGIPGGAGRYFLISMRFVNFFPPLSDAILNDSTLLEITPPFSNQIVFSRFEYHNSKIVNDNPRGRNEYRLYLNNNIDPERNYFQEDDIVVIYKLVVGNREIYKIKRFNSQDNPDEYSQLDQIISQEGTHILVEEPRLSFLGLETGEEIDTSDIVLPEVVKPTAFSLPLIDANRRTYQIGNQSRRIRSQSFRDLVMLFYDYKCAITGEKLLIEHNNTINLQAAHIIAVRHDGGDNPTNGIPLILDLHWAFENGFFTISDDYKVVVHPDVKSEWLRCLDGDELKLPEDSRAKPNLEALAWHRDNFYGKFLRG